MRNAIRHPRGQSTVEWIGLLLVVALLLGAVLAATGPRLPGGELAAAIADRLICAASLSACEDSVDSPLVAAYGEETAVQLRRYAPEVRYEDGSHAMPVDFRRCRSTVCGDGPSSGPVFRSNTGEPPTAFVHVVRRDGRTYLQYWLYYADSATYRGVPYAGGRGFHLDDWESFQVRIGPGGRPIAARASSHQGYGGGQGLKGWAADAGVAQPSGWRPSRGKLTVSGGSHAGQVPGAPTVRERLVRAIAPGHAASRWTPSSRLRLVPIEDLAGSCREQRFAISAPWCKRVYLDPEYGGTD